MPRYFIDTDDSDFACRDEEGHDLPDAEAARRLAQATLPDMARDDLPDGERRTFVARVGDESGTPVYVVTLDLRGEWLVLRTGQRAEPDHLHSLAVSIGYASRSYFSRLSRHQRARSQELPRGWGAGGTRAGARRGRADARSARPLTSK